VLKPKLAKALAQLDGYDLVLIDCPPSLGALTREALAASDLALIVTTPSYFGAQGVERAVAEVEEIRKKRQSKIETRWNRGEPGSIGCRGAPVSDG